MLMSTPEECYLRRAEGQFGLVTLVQLLECGLSDPAIRRRVAAGRLERVHPGIFRIAGSPQDHAQRTMAHLLHAGETAAVSHRAAARRWGWDPFRETNLIEITADKDLRNVPGARFYRATLGAPEVGTLGRFRVTSPTRTIIDLPAVVTEEELEIALDCGMIRSRLDANRIRTALHERGRNGRRGAGVLDHLLQLRADGVPLGRSPLEVRFLRFLRRKRLPTPLSQFPIVLEGRRFVLDFAYPHLKLAIETDGYRWHASRERFESDRDKGNGLTVADWDLLRITNRHMSNEEKLFALLRRALVNRFWSESSLSDDFAHNPVRGHTVSGRRSSL